jgi:UDP-N-acetylglucosamine--N-acetylmuramyl-(pentapeptide) pyrophosphoryl-undecaprenol N-acetylglucosamine transferase
LGAGEHDETAARVLIAGGGTGGHLVPALNLARELAKRPHPAAIMLIGSHRGPDRELLSTSGFRYQLIDAPIVDRHRRVRNATLPWRLGRAVGAARNVVKGFRPDVVVGTGGYVSVPIGVAARMAHRPLILQEQNRQPGLATRFLARWADRVCVAYSGVDRALPGRPQVTVTGNPIAPQESIEAEFAGRLDVARPTLGVFGGSQGAQALNTAIIELFGDESDKIPNVIWQTGEHHYDQVIAAGRWPERVVIKPFFSPMGAVYPLLDLSLCRAGAMTLAELAAWGIPAILVPYPHATADHQMVNARAVEAVGAAIAISEPQATPRRLGNLITGLLDDPARRERMAAAALTLAQPDAVQVIADQILELAGRTPAGGS